MNFSCVKKYLNISVYDATNERLSYIFSNFDRICVSFSGGKDSGLLLNLVISYAKKINYQKKIGVLIIDLEGNYRITQEFIIRMLNDNHAYLDVYWVCLPLNLRNAVSLYEPFWTCWDKEHEDKWIHPLPNYNIITDEQYFPFFEKNMEFEEFAPLFGDWYGKKYETVVAMLIGIRADESSSRYMTVAGNRDSRYRDINWTTVKGENSVNCYPIYDWTVNCVWLANKIFGFDYNGLYDLFYLSGQLTLSQMRTCQPYGDDQRIGLELFKVIEPDTWNRVVSRVSGANFGNIYCGTSALGYNKIELPNGYNWKDYTHLLLASLPPHLQSHFRAKFATFIKFWRNKGSHISNEFLPFLDDIPDSIKFTVNSNSLNDKNRNIVKFRNIPDKVDKLDIKKLVPSWRRLAICIMKNDIICYSLGFSPTKDQRQRFDYINKNYIIPESKEIEIMEKEENEIKISPVRNIKFIPVEKIRSNEYNPNKVAKDEFELLYRSIKEDGYTMPIVCYYDDSTDMYEIVDGFHRYSVMLKYNDIYERENGEMPVSVINKPMSDRMASTIRHNRARGVHSIQLMSNIVNSLLKSGKSDKWIMKHVGMDKNELLRLKQIGGITELATGNFAMAWLSESDATKTTNRA